MKTIAAETALTEMRQLQQRHGLMRGELKRMDACIETIRQEAREQGISTYRMVQLIEGNGTGWRKEWN